VAGQNSGRLWALHLRAGLALPHQFPDQNQQNSADPQEVPNQRDQGMMAEKDPSPRHEEHNQSGHDPARPAKYRKQQEDQVERKQRIDPAAEHRQKVHRVPDFPAEGVHQGDPGAKGAAKDIRSAAVRSGDFSARGQEKRHDVNAKAKNPADPDRVLALTRCAACAVRHECLLSIASSEEIDASPAKPEKPS
jgi:hypothetical protein